jgi:hypothetical protein
VSSVLIVQAVQSILATALPSATVLLGIPRTVNDAAVVYLYHQGYSETPKTTTIQQRTHVVNIHLLLMTAADDDEAELELLQYNDAIADLFYTNRLLNGTAATSQLHQQAVSGGNAPAFIVYGTVEYRHRWWTLDAVEYKTFVYQ